MATATMQRHTPAGVRAQHEVSLAPSQSAAPDPLATTRASLSSMRDVLKGLEARKHGRGFTDNDRIRLLRTRAVDELLTDTVNLVKNDQEAVTYLRWRSGNAEAEAATMQERRPSMWFPGRRRAADEKIREKRAMAQEAASFATSIEVDSRKHLAPPRGAAPAAPRPASAQSPWPAGGHHVQGRVQKGLRGAGQFTAVAHGESGVVLGSVARPTPSPVAEAPQHGPSTVNRDGADKHLRVLEDFLSPLEEAAGNGAVLTPDQETHLARGRRVRRILATASQGCSTDAQVVTNLQAIRGQAEGQLRAAEASAKSATDRTTLAARIKELGEVVKDCGTYRGFLGATA